MQEAIEALHDRIIYQMGQLALVKESGGKRTLAFRVAEGLESKIKSLKEAQDILRTYL